MGPVADLPPQTLLFAGSVVILIYFVFRIGRRGKKAKGGETPTIVRLPRPGDEAGPSKALTPAELSRWEVEIHEMTRDVMGRIDSKMVTLEHLIRDADRAAERLERARVLASSEVPQTESVEEAMSAPAENVRDDEVTIKQTTNASNQADRLRTVAGPEAPSEQTGERLSDDSGSDEAVDRYQEIYTLADYGFSPAEIADRVGTPVGEVELILGLRKDRSP